MNSYVSSASSRFVEREEKRREEGEEEKRRGRNQKGKEKK